MRRSIALLLVCAVAHLAPPIIYLTLVASDPQTASRLFVPAFVWVLVVLVYDKVRMRRYYG